MAIIRDYDVIVNGADNFPARYLVNDAAYLSNKPLVDGSILLFDGQAIRLQPFTRSVRAKGGCARTSEHGVKSLREAPIYATIRSVRIVPDKHPSREAVEKRPEGTIRKPRVIEADFIFGKVYSGEFHRAEAGNFRRVVGETQFSPPT